MSKEIDNLKAELDAAKEHRVELEQEQSVEMEDLRATADRATEATQWLGLVPLERSQDPANATVHDYAQLFNGLAGQLTRLKESLEETLEQEGR